MGDYKAFFYGTLMAPEVLYRVCYGTTNPQPWQKALLTVNPAILHNHERHKVRGADYPGLIPVVSSPSSPSKHSSDPNDPSDSAQPHTSKPTSSSSVRGTLVTGLTQGDLWRLDIFEGDEYKRRNVEVYPLEVVGDETGNGNVESSEPVTVQTYIWIDGRERLEEGEWDFGDFVKTKMARWTGGREEYEEVDEAVAELGGRDPTNGRGMGGAITEKLRTEGADGEVMESAV